MKALTGMDLYKELDLMKASTLKKDVVVYIRKEDMFFKVKGIFLSDTDIELELDYGN